MVHPYNLKTRTLSRLLLKVQAGLVVQEKVAEVRKQTWTKKKRVKEKYKAELYDKAQGKNNAIERSKTFGGNQGRAKWNHPSSARNGGTVQDLGPKRQGIWQEKDPGGPERW